MKSHFSVLWERVVLNTGIVDKSLQYIVYSKLDKVKIEKMYILYFYIQFRNLLFDVTQSEGKPLSFQASGQKIHFHVKLFCSIFKLMTHTYFQIVIFIIFLMLKGVF